MTFPLGQQITFVTRTVSGQDAYGNDVYAETTSTTRGAFNPGTTGEVLNGQDQVTVQPSLLLPAGTDLTAVDAVEVNGLRYEVDGDVLAWQSPFTGWAPGVQVRLKRTTG